MTDPRRQNRRLWNEWSDDFQALWNANTAEGELPPAPSPFAEDAPGYDEQTVLSSVDGKDYAEFGCGGGQGTVGTAALGVASAVGVDLSGDQLAHARRLRDFYGVDARFCQGDVTALPLPDDSVDLASSEAVYQMVPDLEAAFREVRRVCRDGAVFVVSIPHTFFEVVDDDGTVARDYFARGPREIEIDDGYDASLTVFDHTVADLHNALEAAGFDVHRVVEHQRHEVEENEPDESDLPDVYWRLPQSLRCWAVAD
jgi:SAM-dependent methyltransferase